MQHHVCTCQSEKFMTDCLPTPFLRMVARNSLPHILKSLHRLAIAIIIDSTNEEWMTKKLMLNYNKIHQEMSNKKSGG